MSHLKKNLAKWRDPGNDVCPLTFLEHAIQNGGRMLLSTCFLFPAALGPENWDIAGTEGQTSRCGLLSFLCTTLFSEICAFGHCTALFVFNEFTPSEF